MPILQDDIKLMASERLTDNEDGGGRITGNQVQDGASNNLFPDVSDLDRVYGRVNLRKSFLSVETDDTDVYYGSHIILSERPTDPKIGVTLFSTGASADERSNAQQRLESYVVRGPESDYVLLGDQLSGQRMITCYSGTDTAAPDVGDVLMLSQEVNGDVTNYQYVRITAVDYADKEYQHVNYGTYTRRVFNLELSDALRETFPGAESTYWYWAENHKSPTLVRSTQVADASRYYGVSELVEPISTGELGFKVDSIYSQLVPSATTETPVVDVRAGAIVDFFLPLQDALVVVSRPISTGEYTMEFGGAILPGSLDIYNGNYTDDGAGNLVENGSVIGSVNYESGTVRFANSNVGGGVTTKHRPAVKVEQAAHTAAEEVTLSNRGFNYVNNLRPLPTAGTLTVTYMAQGRWYSMSDNGAGGLEGSAGGSGTIDYATGSVVATLAALPDAGSSIIYTWGSDVAFAKLDTIGVTPSQPEATAKLTAPSENRVVVPGSLALQWGGYSATDDGNGRIIGHASGYIDYASRDIRVRPNVLPAAGTVIQAAYNTADMQTDNYPMPTRDGDGNVSLIVAANLLPGTVKLAWHTDMSLPPNGIKIVQIDPVLIARDDGNGLLFLDSGEQIGSVNYSTGSVTFTPDNIVKYPVQVYTQEGDDETTLRFSHITYENVPQIAPPDFDLNVTHALTDPGTATTDSMALDAMELELTPYSVNALVPNSVRFTIGSDDYADRGDGILYADDGTQAGTINYATGLANITWWTFTNSVLSNVSALTQYGDWGVNNIYFRSPGAPLRPSSLYLRATTLDGTLITATSNADGSISGTGVTGSVDYDTGIVDVSFTDRVLPGTAYFNVVVYSTMPLDADVLGLDPVRLPVDGRVPVFRDGDVSVIHHTANTELPTGLAAGQTESLERTRLSHVEVTDANGLTVPDGLWTADKVAGTVTMATPLNLNGYTEPLTATHRIEDMILISDVQVNGQMRSVSQISHDYPTGALVSSAMIVGDLQARAAGVFDQQTWTGEWSDDVVGNATSAEFNDTTYPIAVTNRGAITERWALIFTGTTSFKIIGETVGEIAVGDTSSTIAPTNPNTGQPYFSLNPLGWGNGWSTNNVLRFNTIGANHPMWIARTTLQGAAEGDSDSFRIQIRGNANA